MSVWSETKRRRLAERQVTPTRSVRPARGVPPELRPHVRRRQMALAAQQAMREHARLLELAKTITTDEQLDDMLGRAKNLTGERRRVVAELLRANSRIPPSSDGMVSGETPEPAVGLSETPPDEHQPGEMHPILGTLPEDELMTIAPPGLYIVAGEDVIIQERYDYPTDQMVTGPTRMMARVRADDGRDIQGIDRIEVRPDGMQVIFDRVIVRLEGSDG